MLYLSPVLFPGHLPIPHKLHGRVLGHVEWISTQSLYIYTIQHAGDMYVHITHQHIQKEKHHTHTMAMFSIIMMC